MASGYYPLPFGSRGGIELIAIASMLRALLNSRGWDGILPDSADNSESDNASSDGGYESGLYLAAELIERAVEPPPSGGAK